MEALDPQTMACFQRQADWWNARPDATIPAYVMPVPDTSPVCHVRAAVDLFGRAATII